jgi:hypothetical protein
MIPLLRGLRLAIKRDKAYLIITDQLQLYISIDLIDSNI